MISLQCKRCGTELRNDDEFCYHCGQKTTVIQRMLASRALIGSMIAIIVVILAAVAAYFIWTGKIRFPEFGKGAVVENTAAPENNDKNDRPVQATQKPQSSEPEVTATPEPTEPPFEAADVTDEMKPELKTLTKRIRPFLAFSSKYYQNRSRSFVWDDGTATVMALYNLQQVDGKVKYGDKYSDIKKKVKREMKKLFGDNAKYDLTYGGSYPDYVYRRTGDTVVYNASRITGRTYSMSVDKVIAYEQDKYRVIASACLVSQYNRENKGYVQKYTIYIDKDESAEYGYVVRKVKLYKKKDAKTD